MKIKKGKIIYIAIFVALLSFMYIGGVKVKAYSINDNKCDEYVYSTREEMANAFLIDFNYYCGLNVDYQSMQTKLDESIIAFEEPVYKFFNNQDMYSKWSWINNYFLASSSKYSLRVQTERVVNHQQDAVEYWVIALINMMQGNDLSTDENIGINFSNDDYKAYIKNNGYWIMIRYVLPDNSETIYDYTLSNSVKTDSIYLKNYYLIDSDVTIDYHDVFFTDNITNESLYIKSVKFTNSSTANDISTAPVVADGNSVTLTYTSDDEYNCFYVELAEKMRVTFDFVQDEKSFYSDYMWCEPGVKYSYIFPELPKTAIDKLEYYYTNSYYKYLAGNGVLYSINDIFTFTCVADTKYYIFKIDISSEIKKIIVNYHNKQGEIVEQNMNFISWGLFFGLLNEYEDLDVISLFDSSEFCDYEKIAIYYRETFVCKINSKKAFSSNGDEYMQAIISAVESSKIENSIVYVDFYVVHEDYYFGPSDMYKNISATLTPNDIKNLLANYYIDCDCYNSSNIEYDFSSYIGYADSNGKYPIYISINDKKYKFNVICTNKLNGSYYYNSTLYYSINNNLPVDKIVADFKLVGVLPNVSLSTRFNGTNQISQNFIDGSVIAPGTYSYLIDYDSTSGYSGSVTINLEISSAVNNTTSDPIVSKDEIIEIIATILSLVVVIALVIWIIKKMFPSKYRRHS